MIPRRTASVACPHCIEAMLAQSRVAAERASVGSALLWAWFVGRRLGD